MFEFCRPYNGLQSIIKNVLYKGFAVQSRAQGALRCLIADGRTMEFYIRTKPQVGLYKDGLAEPSVV